MFCLLSFCLVSRTLPSISVMQPRTFQSRRGSTRRSSVWNVSEAATCIVSASGALQPPAPLQALKGILNRTHGGLDQGGGDARGSRQAVGVGSRHFSVRRTTGRSRATKSRSATKCRARASAAEDRQGATLSGLAPAQVRRGGQAVALRAMLTLRQSCRRRTGQVGQTLVPRRAGSGGGS